MTQPDAFYQLQIMHINEFAAHRETIGGELCWIFGRPYLSNGPAIVMVVVRPSVCLSVRNGCTLGNG